MAFAAADEPIKAPYIEVGDCWSYRAENIFFRNRERLENYEICVTHVDRAKNAVMAVARLSGKDKEIDLMYQTDWAVIESITGNLFSPPARYFKFPMKVGDEYSVEFGIKNNDEGWAKWTFKVTGWESVTVPAGTFRALKIEGRSAVGSRLMFWYVREVNRNVKYQYFGAGRSSFGEELTGYKLRP